MSILQFMPFSSSLDSSFWHTFSQKKLDTIQLNESKIPISATFTNSDPIGFNPRISLDYSVFEEDASLPQNYFKAPGHIMNTNTVEKFNQLDKKSLLEQESVEKWEAIKSNKAIDNPSLLISFLMIAFADLKKHNFTFWFGFTALMPDEPITVRSCIMLEKLWDGKVIQKFTHVYDGFRPQHNFSGVFLLKNNSGEFNLAKLSDHSTFYSEGDMPILCYCDPCTSEEHPGWPLRNLLILAARIWKGKSIDVLCLRDRSYEGVRHIGHSLYIEEVVLPDLSQRDEVPKCTGWERNDKQKLGPKSVNLSSTMNPERLSEQSVDLNLKLMRWRLVPELNLNIVRDARCLLLGAGTLGCNVARCLLGWGVRHITLVDNGKVAFSNPVRQSLFTFEDSLNGGKCKSEAAADALKRIFPGVSSRGFNISIPMPGHPVSEGELRAIKSDVAQLEDLVQQHDIIFLLLDTREARWLPTVLCYALNKICINAAMGFDTYLVMRHGVRGGVVDEVEAIREKRVIPGEKLGCYFCNDIVAPTNSTRDRTLDQQCTVSRPGMAYITSSLAVELAVSLLQHPLMGRAPADGREEADSQCILGAIPHQIRGFLSRFQTVQPIGELFASCTGCSSIVIEKYKNEGFDFLMQVFNETSFLEDLTGLTELFAATKDIELPDIISDEECSDD
ncbi:hypothetical protein LOD99_15607 [Oopsacas minuta]|uniref:Ubiquitin-like modifier-activating enzyme ATG7 n=1 Tax=Oopsacas minuta TaxID=111878 RepID=A0AAV7KCS0_9METZ|nr:hypothetical protein LOD99_15607 [Oopsacas minuta]